MVDCVLQIVSVFPGLFFLGGVSLSERGIKIFVAVRLVYVSL